MDSDRSAGWDVGLLHTTFGQHKGKPPSLSPVVVPRHHGCPLRREVAEVSASDERGDVRVLVGKCRRREPPRQQLLVVLVPVVVIAPLGLVLLTVVDGCGRESLAEPDSLVKLSLDLLARREQNGPLFVTAGGR